MRERKPRTAQRRLPFKVKGPEARIGKAVGSFAIGSFALGALATAAVYVGSLAVGRVAVGRLAVRQARIKRLRIDELEVGRFRLTEQPAEATTSPNGTKAEAKPEPSAIASPA
jgi:hypothetical protein